MKKNKSVSTLSVKEILAQHTVSELISTVKDLNLKGYSGKNKGALIELLYQKVVDKAFLEDLLLICDRQVWDRLLVAASAPASAPTPLPSPLLGPCKTIARFGLLQLIEGEPETVIMMPPEVKSIFSQFETDGFLEQKDKSDLLDHYALAVTHLYGIIHQDDFVSIFNAQNSYKTNIDEVFSILIQHVSADAPYGFWNEYLTHSLFEDNEYKDAEDLLHIIDGKQRYIPGRAALLQYRDPYFYEKTPASDRFERHLKEKLHCSEQETSEVTSEFVFACSVDATIEKALHLLEGYNLPLTKESIRELMPLFVDLSNHTRKWSNCGFTPEEVHQKNIRQSSIRQGRKIGRNEPCPCGSGKKYKKCCGR